MPEGAQICKTGWGEFRVNLPRRRLIAKTCREWRHMPLNISRDLFGKYVQPVADATAYDLLGADLQSTSTLLGGHWHITCKERLDLWAV